MNIILQSLKQKVNKGDCMLDIKIKLADVKEQIEEKVRHPYLLKFIESPFIDEDKLLLLISILDQTKLSNHKKINYAITTMLIQIALDTHELVTNEKLDAAPFKSRQLTVLAGVYYSGLYYKILAGIDDVFMVRHLATGIKEVNEHKITVYQKSADTVDRLMSSLKKIESALFEKICGIQNDHNWAEFISNLLFIKRLAQEQELFQQGMPSVVFDALSNLVFSKDNQTLSPEQIRHLLSVSNTFVQQSKEIIETCMSKLPKMDDLTIQRVQAIIK